jgi:hypothetical protein
MRPGRCLRTISSSPSLGRRSIPMASSPPKVA